MLREVFLGKSPTHFQINPIVKAFIVSESFLWSGWNFITPIFAIFATKNISGGDIQIAASAYSVHLLFRTVTELIVGRMLIKASDKKLFSLTITGIMILTLAYLGFAFTSTIIQLFVFYAVAGIGFGIASPPKNSLFSTHIDAGKATAEWGLADATCFICIALAAALGGFIAESYGFRLLFILSAIANTAATIPYGLFIWQKKRGNL